MNRQNMRRFTKTSDIFFKCFLAVFLCMVVLGVGKGAADYRSIKADRAAVTAEIKKEQRKQQDHKKQQEYYNSDSYIEKIAREQLGMVKPNEIIYIPKAD